MPFVKRTLTATELSKIDFGALLLGPRKIPPDDWIWAIDTESDILCTQTIGDIGDARDGRYWYLLSVKNRPTFYLVDDTSTLRSRDGLAQDERRIAIGDDVEDVLLLERLANEAHQVLRPGESISFAVNAAGAWVREGRWFKAR